MRCTFRVSDRRCFATIRDRFEGVDLPPQEGIANYLRQQKYDQKYVNAAARQYLDAVRYVQETVGAGGVLAMPGQQATETKQPPDDPETSLTDDPTPRSLTLVLKGVGDVSISLNVESSVLDEDTQRTLLQYLQANLALLDAASKGNLDVGGNRA